MSNELIEFKPDNEIVFSKPSAKDFQAVVKARMMETGFVPWRYIAFIKYAAKLNNVIFGDSASKNEADKEGDKEFRDYILEELKKYPKGKFTVNGVLFETAEVAHKLDFSHNPGWVDLDNQEKEIKAKKKALEEILKTIPAGKIIFDEEGTQLIGASKSSKSSFKVTLPKF